MHNFSSIVKPVGDGCTALPDPSEPLGSSAGFLNARSLMALPISLGSLALGWTAALLGLGAIAPPAQAAEEIRVLYGPIQLSISIESLETFVAEGRIEPDLASYARRLSDEERAEIRRVLQSSVEVDPVVLSNLLYTPQGEALLGRIGDIIRTRSNSGFYALRAALILAASKEGGATPLGVLQEFPTQSLVIDIDRGLRIARELEQLTRDTSSLLALVEQQARQEAQMLPQGDRDRLYQLRRSGSYPWQMMTLPLDDLTRDRPLVLDLYLPETPGPAPMVLISHGLGSNRSSYRYLAEHLASHGFAVGTLDHPGSNADYVQALFEGAAEQVSEPEEFINRSLDISYVLDVLTRRTAAEAALRGRLDLERVGVVGQSFGGLTALSLGGATMDFQRLQADCPQGHARRDTLNLSLLLQCRASGLQATLATAYPDYLDETGGQGRLKDPRVKAVVAINPIGSIVFGERGFNQIDVPVLMVSGSADVVAPTLFEQMIPFSWLEVSHRYLVLMHKGTHFSTIGSSEEDAGLVDLPDAILGPEPELAQDYMKTLSVAFFQAYLDEEGASESYLSPTAVGELSRDPLPLTIVQSLDTDQVAQAVAERVWVGTALESIEQRRGRISQSR